MTRWLVAIVACLAAGTAAAEVVRVHQVPPDRRAEVLALGDYWGLDWRADYLVLYVSPSERRALERAGFRVETDWRRNRELAAFEAVDRALWRVRGDGTIPGFACYRTVDQTHADLAQLAADHPDLARWEIIGQTWQAEQGNPGGDNIHALVIANQASPHDKAPLVVMAAQHARELTTAEAAARFAEWLIAGYDSDPDRAWLLDHREIHIIAQQNPDGRRQVEDGDGFWRKNFNANACPGSTPGVDLNRNSPWFWGTFSSSFDCSETYRGSAASSEPETDAVETYLTEVFEPQRPGGGIDDPAPDDARGIFLSLHSFGEMVLIPWEGLDGGNENNAPNHDGLTLLGRKFGFYTDYAVGRWQLLGPAGGTTVDYAYGDFGVAAYTIEMGTSFHQDCSVFENTIWPDMRQALHFAAKAARRPYLAASGPEVTGLSLELSGGMLEVSGSADDDRFFRGGVSEPPAADPVFDIMEVTASLDVPPHLAAQTYSLAIIGSGSQVDFAGTVPASGSRVFVVATDSAGNTGVATVAVSPDLIFNNGFE